MQPFWRLVAPLTIRFCSGKFEVDAELARYLVYMKFFQMMQVAAPQMKKVSVPIVIAPEGADLCMEIHVGNVKTSTGEIKFETAAMSTMRSSKALTRSATARSKVNASINTCCYLDLENQSL